MLRDKIGRNRFRVIIPSFPSFNIYSHAAKRTTALGPVCVASSVSEMEGWDSEVIDENNFYRYGPKNALGMLDHKLLQELRPADVIGLYGGLTSTAPRLYEIARYYKGSGILTIAGGQHFAEGNIKEGLLNGIDYIVIGEGEETIKELLCAFKTGADMEKIKGLAFLKDNNVFITPEREPIFDFDKFPLPDFSLVRYAKIAVYPIERIRGCGMDCEFCTVKGRPRVSSPERMFERISLLVETRNARQFFVVDDFFGQERDETIRFCNILEDYQEKIGKRLDFGVQIRLDKAKDQELLAAMRRANINFVAIGLESPIEEELQAMNKHLKPQDMLENIRIFRKAGFLVHGMFIFGYPMKEGVDFLMSAKDRVKRFREFIKKSKLDTIQVMLPVPLPGTGLRKRLEAERRVYSLDDIGWEYYDGTFPLFEPDYPMSAEETQYSVRKIMGKFYKFKYLFMVVLHLFLFPSLVFFLYDLRHGWRIWYRTWRNNIIRFGGWSILKQWIAVFKRDNFLERLDKAKKNIRRTG